MALLNMLSPPGNLDELTDAGRAVWSDHVAGVIAENAAAFPQFVNPLATEADPTPIRHPVTWPAFPRSLRASGSVDALLEAADERDNQDEYCEWGVTRDDDGVIRRVTFTTETPDYFEQVLAHDLAAGLLIYSSVAGRAVEGADVIGASGRLNWSNSVNRADDGTIVHLSQGSNNLGAAVNLAGPATVLRVEDGQLVIDPPSLVRCGGLGVATRSSDPQIASAVNRLAARRREVTLADPAGLYLDGFLAAGIDAPDGADVRSFWRPDGRGDAGHVMRAVFEVPEGRGYRVGDLRLDGRKIRFGSQLAQRVQVRLTVLSRPSDHDPVPQRCVA
jgi:hypothetical protein